MAASPIDLVLTTPLYYNFATDNKTLTGSFSFNQSAVADQQVTIAEGLKISVTYNGQTYSQALDPEALLFTDSLGDISDLGLGLQFVIPNLFTINAENLIPANLASSLQTITYSRVSGLPVDENVAANTSIGTLSTIDPDANDAFT